MKPADEHSRWDEDLAAYAVGALPARETVAFAAHLAACDRCRGELHRLAPAVELLPASVEQLEPPPALRGRIMDAIAAHEEAAAGEAAPAGRRAAPSGEAIVRGRRAAEPAASALTWRERLRGWRIPALPAAAATAAGLAAAFALGSLLRGGEDPGPPQRATVPVAATQPGAPVDGRLVEQAGSWRLAVRGLPALRGGRVYQAWVLRDGASAPEPSTLFVGSRDGSADVAIPQRLEAGDQLLVTREPAGGSAAPTARPLLAARI